MPRQARLDASGVLHHVMGREIQRRRLVPDDTDRADVSGRLAARVTATGLTGYAGALRPHTTPTCGSERAGQVMADFKVGEIVQLRSGGPKLTVVEELNHLMMGVRPSVLCSWFAGSKNEQKDFPPAALILLDEEASERTE